MAGIMVQAAFLVIAILMVRKLFGAKLHAYVRYGLWLLAALRLLIPINPVDSPFSMLQTVEMIRLSNAVRKSADWQAADYTVPTGVLNEQEVSSENILQSVGTGMDTGGVSPVENPENTAANAAETGLDNDRQTDHTLRTDSKDWRENDTAQGIDVERVQSTITEAYLSGVISRIQYTVWLVGSLLVGGALTVSHVRFRRRLHRTRTVLRDDQVNIEERRCVPIYRVKQLDTPCLVGFVRPAVYIGENIDLESDYFRYAVTHEEVHYLHLDHIWALIRAALVVVYWFHPFVWIAAVCSAKDGETACDYGTIRRIGSEERFTYAEMLLTFSQTNGGNRVYTFGTMLRPGRSELKNRILQVTKTNTSRAWAGILTLFLMAAAAGCAFTGASEINGAKTILLVNEAGNASTDTVVNDNADVSDSEDTEISGETLSEAGEPQPGNKEGIMAKAAEISGETPLGADGPHLDYAGRMGTDEGARIIFHDYFGLIVYDLNQREVVRSLDLAYIGCDKTQGEVYCETVVSADGQTVWLHPRTKEYRYRYEVEENLLYQEPMVKTLALDLEAEDLFDRYMTVEEPYDWWRSNYLYEEYKDEQGPHNAYIYLWASGDSDSTDTTDYKLMLRNLNCAWDDMEFMLFPDGTDALESTDVENEEELQGNLGDDPAAGFPYTSPYDINNLVEIWYGEPCVYDRISDAFGERVHPFTGEVRVHDGIDYAAAEGTDIVAAADGEVYETGYSAQRGNYVVILHMNGDMTYYCQCREITVEEGEQVKRGDKIATVGKTGMATGSHLHFALSRDGRFINPQEHIRVREQEHIRAE